MCATRGWSLTREVSAQSWKGATSYEEAVPGLSPFARLPCPPLNGDPPTHNFCATPVVWGDPPPTIFARHQLLNVVLSLAP